MRAVATPRCEGACTPAHPPLTHEPRPCHRLPAPLFLQSLALVGCTPYLLLLTHCTLAQVDWALIEQLKSGDVPPQRRYCTARWAVYQPPHLVLFMDRYPDGAGLAMDRLHVAHHRMDTDDMFDMFPP